MSLLKLPFEEQEQAFLLNDVIGVSPLPRGKSTSDDGTFESNLIGIECDTGSKKGRLQSLKRVARVQPSVPGGQSWH